MEKGQKSVTRAIWSTVENSGIYGVGSIHADEIWFDGSAWDEGRMVIQQTEKPVKWGVRSDKNPKPVTCKLGDLQGVVWA